MSEHPELREALTRAIAAQCGWHHNNHATTDLTDALLAGPVGKLQAERDQWFGRVGRLEAQRTEIIAALDEARAQLAPYAAAGRWVLDNSNAYDRHTNAHVAGAWHVYEEASGRNPVAETSPADPERIRRAAIGAAVLATTPGWENPERIELPDGRSTQSAYYFRKYAVAAGESAVTGPNQEMLDCAEELRAEAKEWQP